MRPIGVLTEFNMISIVNALPSRLRPMNWRCGAIA